MLNIDIIQPSIFYKKRTHTKYPHENTYESKQNSNITPWIEVASEHYISVINIIKHTSQVYIYLHILF